MNNDVVSISDFVGPNRSALVTKPKTPFGGYAETIIQDPADYDALEIQGVRDLAGELGIKDGSTCCEVDNERPQFFSVYAHLVEGGVDCIGDFAHVEEAQSYAGTIASQHGWNAVDYTAGTLTERLP
jgi:hypothetical protein